MTVTIATHNGGFHADDVFGVAILLIKLTREGVLRDDILIVRTRDEDVIRNADYVLDVGGEYDPLKKRFDHHQPGGAGKRDNGIPYAAFGLLWNEYGVSLSGTETVAQRIDERLVAPTDAEDNGYDVVTPLFDGIKTFAIPDYVGLFVPTWKEADDVDTRFLEVVSFAVQTLERIILVERDRFEGNKIAQEVYETMEDRRLLILDNPVPWKRTADTCPELLFVVLPDKNPQNGWRVYTVRKHETSFENRQDLPAEWAGLKDGELAQVTGVSDARFCHNKLFTCAAGSREGALALAHLALNQDIQTKPAL